MRFVIWFLGNTFGTFTNLLNKSAEPPKIMPFQFPEELEVGGSTQATCSLVSGDKPIQFIWHKDNLPIPSILKVLRIVTLTA